MASPFPGMDPYLERTRGDVHQSLITYARDQIQALLPGDLAARTEERIYVGDEDRLRELVADVAVVERPRRGPVAETPGEGVLTSEPLVIRVEAEPFRESFIEIIDLRSGRRVVTVIEVLSLANKRTRVGRTLYRKKQRHLRRGRVSLVEIDLLRAGPRVLSVPVELIPETHRTTYQVCVRRGHEPEAFEVYRAPLRGRLPVIRIPLRPGDDDVPLDLQVIVDQAYRNGRYEGDIDYRADPVPPLDPDDAAWADAMLREKGLR